MQEQKIRDWTPGVANTRIKNTGKVWEQTCRGGKYWNLKMNMTTVSWRCYLLCGNNCKSSCASKLVLIHSILPLHGWACQMTAILKHVWATMCMTHVQTTAGVESCKSQHQKPILRDCVQKVKLKQWGCRIALGWSNNNNNDASKTLTAVKSV